MAIRGPLLAAGLAAALVAGPLADLVTPATAAAQANSNSQPQGDAAVTYPRKPASLKVPGAQIYYEVRGSGPILLMIPGGPADAGVFADVSQHLAGRYTVVAYDPRGNSRSTFDGAPEDLRVEVQADDAAALIEALGGGPAHVFGTSGGAQIGLELAARYPGLVGVLVAHEPPTMMLLTDPSAEVAAARDLHDTYRRDGVETAMRKFFADNGLDEAPEGEDAPPEFAPSPEEAETFERVSGNFEYWLAHGMLPLSFYRPDVEVLTNGKPRIVVGIGEESAGQPIEKMAMGLADGLGARPVRFPGDHMGFGMHAESFAATLHRTIESQ